MHTVKAKKGFHLSTLKKERNNITYINDILIQKFKFILQFTYKTLSIDFSSTSN